MALDVPICVHLTFQNYTNTSSGALQYKSYKRPMAYVAKTFCLFDFNYANCSQIAPFSLTMCGNEPLPVFHIALFRMLYSIQG